MRYYLIIITNPSTGKEIIRWSSQSAFDGSNNLSSQQIDFDITVYALADQIGASMIKVSGVSIQQVGSAFNFNNMNISMFAGMSKGLPLSNPQQQGLIMQGTIQQCFGNFYGTNQDLNFIVQSAQGTASSPKNIVLNWQKGQNLAEAIKNTLQIAFPGYALNINISENLTLANNEPGYFQTAPQFAQYIQAVSKHINPDPTYRGVRMLIGNNSFTVYDGTTQSTPKDIGFTELVGQPVYQSLTQINFRTVLRADIGLSDYVNMPKTIAVQTPQSFSQFRNSSIFQGVFQIDSVRHLGNFRGTSGTDWVTIFDAHNTVVPK